MSGEAFFTAYVAKYGDTTLHSEYYECLLGNKAIKNRKSKATRMYVVLTNHRFFAMSVSKILKKLEVAIDCHWYDLRVIGNTQGNRLFLQFDGKDKEIEIVSQADALLVKTMRTAIAMISAGYDDASLPKLDMPADRVASLIDPVDVGVAGGILPTYHALCSYYGMPPSPTFAAFINDVVNRGQNCVNLSDLPGIDSQGDAMHLMPVLASFAHNTYFKGLVLTNASRPEVFKCATAILRAHNQVVLTKLVLHELSGDGRDAKTFLDEWSKSNARQTNQITHLDLGGNKIGDAMSMLAEGMESLKHGVDTLHMGDCSASSSGISELFTALSRNLAASLVLGSLTLDGAKFDADANSCLAFWLGLVRNHGALHTLSLVGCSGFDVAQSFCPLVQASSHNLVTLDVSQNKLDAAFLSSQVIASAAALRTLRVSDCGLSAELFDQIASAVGGNRKLSDFQLVASNNQSLGANVAVVTACLQKCQNVTRLDLRSCGFTFHAAQLVLDTVNTLLHSLRSVFIGGVGAGQLKKPGPETVQQMTGFGYAVSKAMSVHPNMQEFGLDSVAMNLQGWRVLFGDLGKARISRLVLTDARMGDAGMTALCEGLRVNASLTSVELDGNRFSFNGFLDLRAALRVARHITHLPLPMQDVTVLQAQLGKPGSARWSDVTTVLNEIASLIAVNASTNGYSPWDTQAVAVVTAPDAALALAMVPAELLPQHMVPPKYADKKAWQEWKLAKMDAKLRDFTDAALAGGYVAGSGTSGGSAPPPRPPAASDPIPAAPSTTAEETFGTNTLNLLSGLDLGDDGGGEEEGGYYDEAAGGDDYADETINVGRAPPPPPSDY